MTQEDISSEEEGILRTIIAQSGGVFLGSVVALMMGFGSNFIIARYFGSEVMGRYALAINILTLVGLGTIFGVDQGFLKYIPQYQSDGEDEHLHRVVADGLSVSAILALAAGGGLVAGHEILAYHLFGDPELAMPLFWAGLMLVPYTLFKVLGGLYKGFKYAAYYKFAGRVALKFIFLLATLGLLWVGYRGTNWVIGLYCASYFLVLGHLLVQTRLLQVDVDSLTSMFRTSLDPETDTWEIRREFFTFSGSMIMISAVTFLCSRIDIFMLGLFVESRDIGHYKVAMMVTGILSFTLGAINSIFPAFISEMFARGDMEQLEKIYSRITRWMLVVNLPPVLSMCLFPEPILAFFGEEYTVAWGVLVVLALGRFGNASVGSNGHILKMGDNEHIVFWNNLAMGVINVVANLILISKYGILGAAFATALSTYIISSLKLYQVKTIFDILPYDWSYLSVPLGAIVMGIIAYGVRPWVNGVPAVVGVTLFNMLVMLSISWFFIDDLDRQLFERIRAKLARSLNI